MQPSASTDNSNIFLLLKYEIWYMYVYFIFRNADQFQLKCWQCGHKEGKAPELENRGGRKIIMIVVSFYS